MSFFEYLDTYSEKNNKKVIKEEKVEVKKVIKEHKEVKKEIIKEEVEQPKKFQNIAEHVNHILEGVSYDASVTKLSDGSSIDHINNILS